MANNNRYTRDVDLFDKLKRELWYATTTNNETLVNETKATLITLEKSTAKDDTLGLWGHSFDFLVERNSRHLDIAEEELIITDLHSRFDRAEQSNNTKKVHICESAGLRLARYYRKKGVGEKTSQIIKRLCAIIEIAAKNSPLATFALFQYQKAREICAEFQMKSDADYFLNLIRETTPKISSEMQVIPMQFSISNEEMEEFCNNFTCDNLQQSFGKIVRHFMYPKQFYKDQVQCQNDEFTIQALFSKAIISSDGHYVADVTPDNEEGTVIFYANHILQIVAPFLHNVFEHVFKKYNVKVQDVIDYLGNCLLFSDREDQEILRTGIEHYFNSDYCSAMHVLIPQIERAVRKIAGSTGATVWKSRTGGGYHQKTLDNLLWDVDFLNFWRSEDIPWYLRVVLSDQRGWNLRNDVCHGLRPHSFFTVTRTERLLHILLLLATEVGEDTTVNSVT
jgi:hypothetical protein